MIQRAVDYHKIALQNKYYSLGLLSWGASASFLGFMLYSGNRDLEVGLSGIAMGAIAGICLWKTAYGQGTVKAYRNSRSFMKRNRSKVSDYHPTIERHVGRVYSKYPYCEQKGMEIAAKEQGLETLVKSLKKQRA